MAGVCFVNKRNWVGSIYLFFIITAGFFFLCYLGWDKNPQRIQRIMLIAIIALIPIFFMNPKLDKMTKWTWIIIIAGMIMRIGYALYTPTTVRIMTWVKSHWEPTDMLDIFSKYL